MKIFSAHQSKLLLAITFSIAFGGLYSPVQAQTAPSSYSAYTGTDVKTPPPAPALGPANSVINDPTFGTPILRVTDPNTNGGESFISTDAGSHRSWNADSTAIKLTGPYGDGYWLEFNPASIAVGDGSATPQIHSVPFGANWEWSTVDPDTIYYLNGTQLAKYNTATGVSTNLAGTPTGEPVGYFAVVVGQDSWVCSAAGSGNQNTYTKLFCVNPVSPSVTKFIDVVNETINGVAQSDPNWPTSASGQVIGVHSISGGTGANWLQVNFHQQSWGGNGDSVFDLATNTWSLLSNADIYWSGHNSMGNGTFANSSGSQNGLDSRGMLLRNPDNLMNSSQYQFVGQPSAPWNGWCDEDHNSWLNSLTNGGAPILQSRYGGNTGCAYTWTGEIIGIAVDGSNTVYRFAHNHNLGDTCYYGEAFAQISNDGQWALFSSPWDGNLGADTAFGCTTRIDTFILALTPDPPSSSGAGSGSSSGSSGTSSGSSTSGTSTSGGSTSGSTSSNSGSGTSGSTGSTTSSGTTSGTTTTNTSVTTQVLWNGSGVTYTGTWDQNYGAFNIGGSAVLAQNTGSTATIVFNGTGVTWIGVQDPWSGIAQVSVDGVLQATVDTYSSTEKTQSPVYTVSGLSSGQHTMTITVMGRQDASASSNWVWVNAFNVVSGGSTSGSTSTSTGSGSSTTSTSGTSTSGGSTSGNTSSNSGSGTSGSTGSTTSSGTTSGTTTTNTSVTTQVLWNGTGVTYTGTWDQNYGAFNIGGSAVLAQNAGSTATIVFNGTGVTWIGVQDPWSGIAQVSVDGVLQATVDTYSSTEKTQSAVYTVSGLSNGQHRMTITVTGRQDASASSNWVWVNAFKVVSGGSTSGSTSTSTGSGSSTTSTGTTTTPTPALSTYRIKQTSPDVKWSGTWYLNTGSFNSGGSSELAMNSGGTATFTFARTSVSWIGNRDQWSGIAKVYIDGNLAATIDTHSSPAKPRQLYTRLRA